MQRGHQNRTPSLSSSLADSRSPSPYSRSQSRPQPPYPTTSHRSSEPLHASRTAVFVSEARPLRTTPNGGEQKEEKKKDKEKRRPSVSFLKDQIKEKIVKGGEKSTTKDDKKKKGNSSNSALKTSLVFLGSVAAATFVANRFWPRGITYGEKEEWEEEESRRPRHDRRRRRSISRQRRQRRRGSFDDDDEEGEYRLYRGGSRGSTERVIYEGDEPSIRRAPSRGRPDDSRYTVIEVIPSRGGSCRPASTRQDPHQSYVENICNNSRAGDRRRSSSSHYYHHYHDGSERRYYSPVRRQHEEPDDDEFVIDIDDGRHRSSVCREPRYVEHEVTTLRRSSSDDPYTTTERVVRRQYRVDER
ncbi:hypothetical protein PG990_015248 [Apiospora arundinis]